jgi:hypothetical protein
MTIDIPEFLSSVGVPFSKLVPVAASVNLGLPDVSLDMSLTIWPQGYRRQVTCALYRLANLLKAVFYWA